MKKRQVTTVLLLLASLAIFGCRAAEPAAPPATEPVPTAQPTEQRIESVPTAQPTDEPAVSNLQESTRDMLGFYKTSPAYQAVIDAGVRVVNVPELGSFFALWIPDSYAEQEVQRVMALVHGTSDNAYSTIAGQLRRAQHHNYALVAVQWWMGEGEIYLPTDAVYQLLAAALEYVGQEYGADIHKAAYEGFSRGSAIAYQIAYLDRSLASNYFALFICQSGGMHDPGPPFMQSLRAGNLGDDAFGGQHFFMYCGMKDEQWGTAMCEYMHNAEQTVIKYGGTVERFIEDPQGGHAGLLKTDAHYEDAIKTWFELTTR